MIVISVSKAAIRATDKYNAKTYKQIQTKIKIADYNMIDDYCKKNNISKAQTIVKSIKYCIENNIDIKNYTPAVMEKEVDN